MKYRVILSDPPWNFSDSLTMSDTKRGASSVYNTMSIEDLKSLQVKDIAEDDAVLLLWCPSSLLQDGLDVMKAWGFRQTQTHIWVKTKQFHLKDLVTSINKWLKSDNKLTSIEDIIKQFALDGVLAFGMGRLFRQTHELVLVGVRGKIYNHLVNKSQRSVHFYQATKHSTKPDTLQLMLEEMFPGVENKKLEMFARREKNGWICIGNQSNLTKNEDIKTSLSKLVSLKEISSPPGNSNVFICHDQKVYKVWKDIPTE